MVKALRQQGRELGKSCGFTISAGSEEGFRLVCVSSGTFQVCLPGFWKY